MIEEDNTLNRIKELKNYTPIKIILMVIVVLYHSMIIYAGGGLGILTSEQLMPQYLGI